MHDVAVCPYLTLMAADEPVVLPMDPHADPSAPFEATPQSPSKPSSLRVLQCSESCQGLDEQGDELCIPAGKQLSQSSGVEGVFSSPKI